MIDRLDDTIVAISSAPGSGPLGIVRLSGRDAIPIGDQMLQTAAGSSLRQYAGSSRVAAEVHIDVELTLPASVYLFRAPHSYTRQDLVEIHTVGSAAALELVRRHAVSLGAIPAQAGEFTARAFLNGGMNLTSAEAVASAIRAQSDTQLRAARRQMDGALSKAITEARDALAELLALVEADIDFAEEPIEFITPPELAIRLQDVRTRLDKLVEDAISAERQEILPRILLLGPPNAGKSSLMNRLTGTNRAIISAVAGTTRDILSAPIHIGNAEALLLDSAGVDQSLDEVIALARRMTLSTADRVDLICLVFDISKVEDAELFEMLIALASPRVVVAPNKMDLVSLEQRNVVIRRWEAHGIGSVCAISALTGEGIEQLRNTLANSLGTAPMTVSAECLVLSERQRTSMTVSQQAIIRAMDLSKSAMETVDCADLLALELREALDSLGEITGDVTTEDLLGQVFARFCIGK